MTIELKICQCVLLSIRLNSTAVVKLLNETGASSVIVSSRTAGHIKDAILKNNEAGRTRVVTYAAAPFDRFVESPIDLNASQRFAQCRQSLREDDQNVIILHSSGTTGKFTPQLIIVRKLHKYAGLPKAIPLGHRYLLGYAACHLFPPTEDESKCGVNLSTLPLFHVSTFNIITDGLADIWEGFWCLGSITCFVSGKDSLFPAFSNNK